MKIKASVVILTKNSLRYLKENNNIFKNFEEVIIVDDFSSDMTEGFCKKNSFRFVRRELGNDFSSQRNAGQTLSRNEWILFLDSDETVDEGFLDELVKITQDSPFDGYRIKRQVNFLGKNMIGTEMGNDWVLRLARKQSGKWVRRVHEYWKVAGKIGNMDSVIFHKTAVNLNTFIGKLNAYAKTHSEENKSLKKKPNLIKTFAYPVLKFAQNYLLHSGYKDGTHGFVVSVLMSFHSFVAWSDYWLSSRRKD